MRERKGREGERKGREEGGELRRVAKDRGGTETKVLSPYLS